MHTLSVSAVSTGGWSPILESWRHLSVLPNCTSSTSSLVLSCVLDLPAALINPHSPAYSAANDFCGKQFLALSVQKKMNQSLAVATGCAAGATESFVVVPFELINIKYVALCLLFASMARS